MCFKLARIEPDPASFKDPEARVFSQGGKVYRCFNQRGAERFLTFTKSGLLDAFIEGKQVIPTRLLPTSEVPELLAEAGQPALVVEHDPVPWLSYCYEWPFDMLRAAAILHLELLRQCLDQGFMLKDSTPYNIQFIGPRPVFIDVASFEPWQEGSGWKAYTQFCRLFLNPLLLEAYAGVRFQPWLRGSLEGIDAAELSHLIPFRHKLRGSVWRHVTAQAWLNRQLATLPDGGDLLAKSASVGKKQVLRLMDRLLGTVSGLKPRGGGSPWVSYDSDSIYSAEARQSKQQFVERALSAAAPHKMIWDLGCNTGKYSKVASGHSQYVVALDKDPDVVNILFRQAQAGYPNILPLVMDVANPSPDQGWNQAERRGLTSRGQANFVLFLALTHHLAISGNVPLKHLVAWLARMTQGGVLEFVPKSDPMVQRLLRWRDDIYADYTPASLEAALEEHFRVTERAPIPGLERTLYAFAKQAR